MPHRYDLQVPFLSRFSVQEIDEFTKQVEQRRMAESVLHTVFSSLDKDGNGVIDEEEVLDW